MVEEMRSWRETEDEKIGKLKLELLNLTLKRA